MTYLEELQSTLDTSKEMLQLLNNRIAFLSVYSHKSPYQINEDKINILKTKGEINTLRSIIFEKEKYFEKFAKQFEVDKTEMESNFDSLLKQVKIKRLKDNKLDNLMKGVNMENVLSSVETKLAFYKTIKSFLKQ